MLVESCTHMLYSCEFWRRSTRSFITTNTLCYELMTKDEIYARRMSSSRACWATVTSRQREFITFAHKKWDTMHTNTMTILSYKSRFVVQFTAEIFSVPKYVWFIFFLYHVYDNRFVRIFTCFHSCPPPSIKINSSPMSHFPKFSPLKKKCLCNVVSTTYGRKNELLNKIN